MHCKRPFYLSYNFFMVSEAAKFFFVSSQSRHLGFVNLINVSSRPLPTSRRKVAVVVVVVKSEPLYYITEDVTACKELSSGASLYIKIVFLNWKTGMHFNL